MPGSLMLEGMAQTAGILLGEKNNFEHVVILAKVLGAKYTDAKIEKAVAHEKKQGNFFAAGRIYEDLEKPDKDYDCPWTTGAGECKSGKCSWWNPSPGQNCE